LLQLSASNTHPILSTAHDDIVIAIALAAWQASRSHPELLPPPPQSLNRWHPVRSILYV
jgi:hypothetical protein